MATANSSRSAIISGKDSYGVKISKDTHDIYEADRYMIMQSKYPVLKLCKSGNGVGSQVAESGGFTVTIPHNLGYVPICFVSGEYYNTTGHSVVARQSDWNKWIYQGLQVADLYYYYADTNNLYIKLETCYLTDADSFNLNYTYHIFYDGDETL